MTAADETGFESDDAGERTVAEVRRLAALCAQANAARRASGTKLQLSFGPGVETSSRPRPAIRRLISTR